MRILRLLVLLGVVLIAGTSGFLFHKAQLSSAVQVSGVGQQRDTFPSNPLDWTFLDTGGEERSISDWAPRLLVINFWATWCPPCITEIPGFVRIQEALDTRDVQFVGIALDSTSAVLDFSQSNRVNYPFLVGDDDVIAYMQQLGNDIGALPYTVVLSNKGQVLHSHQGEWEEASAKATIGKLLLKSGN